MLQEEGIVFEKDTMDAVIKAVSETLLTSEESISTKIDAISLLICIVIKYPEDYRRNANIFEKLFEEKDRIEVDTSFHIFSNINDCSLKIGLHLLYALIGKDAYSEVLEVIPYIQNDIPTIIAIAGLIADYLEIDGTVNIPCEIEPIILQSVLQWLRSENLDVRWNSTRILVAMSRNKDNGAIINHELEKLIDTDCLYIKNLIIRRINKERGIEKDTKEYIMKKCESDANLNYSQVSGHDF